MVGADSLDLSWRDDEWPQQSGHRDCVTEPELWQTLNMEYRLIRVVRSVCHCGGIQTNVRTTPSQAGTSLIAPRVV